MVGKRDIIEWFSDFKSYDRIEVMCGILQMCHPFELRLIGTCLEELARRDCTELRATENEANSVTDILAADLQSIKNVETRQKLALYISLLHSTNYICADAIYKILTQDDISSAFKPNLDTNDFEELLLVYTMAVNHPAFTTDQKLILSNILKRIQIETRSVVIESEDFSDTKKVPVEGRYINNHPLPTVNDINKQPHHHHHFIHASQFQGIQPACLGVDEQQLLGFHNNQCPPLPVANSQLSDGLCYFRVPQNGANAGIIGPWASYVLPNQHQPPTPSVTSTDSRTESPLRNSPSPPPVPRSYKSNITNGNLYNQTIKDAIIKEIPSCLSLLQNYNVEQLSRFSDDELRDLNLNQTVISQLRSILTRFMSNGTQTTKKSESLENETPGMYRNRPENIPMYSTNVLSSPQFACVACLSGIFNNRPTRSGVATPFHVLANVPQHTFHHPVPPHGNLREISNNEIASSGNSWQNQNYRNSLNGGDSTSGSGEESGGSDQSPPDTPGPPTSLLTCEVSGDNANSNSINSDEKYEETCNELKTNVTKGSENIINDLQVTEQPKNIGNVSVPNFKLKNNYQANRGRSHYAHRKRGVGELRHYTNGIHPIQVPQDHLFPSQIGPCWGGHQNSISESNLPVATCWSIHHSTNPYHHLSYIRPSYPAGTQPVFLRYPAVHHHNDMYFNPSHNQNQQLASTSHVQPTYPAQARTSCYNCGSQNHLGLGCIESTMEDLTNKSGYKLDLHNTSVYSNISTPVSPSISPMYLNSTCTTNSVAPESVILNNIIDTSSNELITSSTIDH